MLRADWQKRRLVRLEAGVTRALLAETPGQSLAEALLSNSPAAKLLLRTQRQIAAMERTWFRARKELLDTEPPLENTSVQAPELESQAPSDPPPPAQLASFPPQEKSAAKTAKSWPPVDEKTGRPLYFVG